MAASPNPLLWSFCRQVGVAEATGGMVHHADARSSDLYLSAGVREQNANVQFGHWEDASWGQILEFDPSEYATFELDQPFAGNVYAAGVLPGDPRNQLFLLHYTYDPDTETLVEISKSPVNYRPVSSP